MRNKKIFFTLTIMLAIPFVELWSGGKKDAILPNPSNWERIVSKSWGSTVTFCMWGGSDSVNSWIDTIVTDGLKVRYGINLKRIAMDAEDFVSKLRLEKQTGKENGDFDLLWINGENFQAAKDSDLLWGPFAEELPNYKRYVDPKATRYDFGYPTEGYEAPFGQSWFVLIHDMQKVPIPPATFAELTHWIKTHPGRFTWPQLPDFTGSAFMRLAFYHVNGGADKFLGKYDPVLAESGIELLKSWLEDITPYLWKEGLEYPENGDALDILFVDKEIDYSMSYNMSHASNKIARGEYPVTARSFVPESLALNNFHYTAIPFNAPNKNAALVVANYLLSIEMQLSKMQPANWGDLGALDPYRMSLDDLNKFHNIIFGPANLPPEELTRNAVPEIIPQYVIDIEKFWVVYIQSLQNITE